ncbi:MAG TPA: RNA polymerase sigma-70 factor [Parasegetibacter sp.]
MPRVQDHNQLMEAFRKGEAAAEDLIFRRYFRQLCFFADHYVNDIHAAEDIVSETFVKMYQKRSEFEKPENIKAFLFVAIRNACINYLEARKRSKNVIRVIESLTTNTDEPLTTVVQNEMLFAGLVHEIYAEIENLPDKCRTIFKMIYFQQLGTEEISSKLNINPQTVRSQKARALQILKTVFLKRKLTAVLALSGAIAVLYTFSDFI